MRLLFKDASRTTNKSDQLPTNLVTHTHTHAPRLPTTKMASNRPVRELILAGGLDGIPAIKEAQLFYVAAVC